MLSENLQTQRLLLVASHPKLAPKVLEYYLRNRAFLKGTDPPRPEEFFTLGYQKRLLALQKREMARCEGVRYWLMPGENGDVIGMVALNNIVRGNFGSAYIAYSLDADHLNSGYVTEALQALINQAFQTMRLHRLEVDILPDNGPSLRVAEKLGFGCEGMAQKFLNINGQWRDHVRFALLNEPKQSGANDVQMELARPGQEEKLGALHLLCWRQAYSGLLPKAGLAALQPQQFAAYCAQSMGQPNAEYYAVNRGNQPAGLLALGFKEQSSGAEGEITAMYLVKAYWRMGFGTQMMEYAVARFKARGSRVVSAWVLQENLPARHFFESCGFVLQSCPRNAIFGGETMAQEQYLLEL